MGAFLANTTAPDAYPTAPQLGGLSTPYERGQILVANNPIVLTVFRGSDRGGITQDEYSYVTPSLIPLVRGQKEYIYGVQFKNAIAGSPAQVSGYLIEPGVAGLGAGSAFTQSVAAGGGVTPGLASVQVQKDGVLIGTEPILDVLTGRLSTQGFLWQMSDDGAGTRVKASVIGPPVVDFAAGDTLPAGVPDGFTVAFLPHSTNFPGVRWLLQWNNTTSFWDVLGGNPLVAEVTTFETTANAAYTALATAGPSIPLPRPGDYYITVAAQAFFPENAAGFVGLMSYDIGATGAVDADAVQAQGNVNPGAVDGGEHAMRTRRKNGLSNVTLTAKYRASSGTTTAWRDRTLLAMPIRIT